MPDIETLMQEWPPEFEEMLKNINLPSADLDCELTEYIDIICCKYFCICRNTVCPSYRIVHYVLLKFIILFTNETSLTRQILKS